MASDVAEIEAAMRANPADIRFSDACKVAESYFGPPRQQGTSHCVYKMNWAGDPRVNLQKGKAGKAKPYQIRQLIDAIDRLRELRARAAAQTAAAAAEMKGKRR